ncbi:FAD-dependent monooxygenase [Henriciella litoralis]|uniref:FAD-dependent monooxygenase n=1 Tax=Henriciella litoralis TaxID=568102 RepID=UPI001F3D7280|nr:FAD-dependent monooxygenase [Henriciella litoralis]
MPRHAIIVGAGIGGLTAALCLTRQGWQVTVLEAASALENVGAGLQLSPNATRVLLALGLEAPLRKDAFEPEALELCLGRSGQRIFRIPVGSAAETRWGAPYLHIHRADLVRVLADATQGAGNVDLRLNSPVERYENREDGVSVTTKSGETLNADIVIGADGIHSTLRAQMLGPEKPRFTGNLAWRVTVPIHRLNNPPPPTACVWAGRGRHAVTYRLCGGDVVNFVGVVERSDWRGESWVEEGSRRDMLADYAGWNLTLTEIINKADSHFRWALFDRPALSHWTDGRVALLGDACHPMLPFMAQGAAMGIEDAWVLAEELSRDVETPAALKLYETRRLPRATRVQVASRANMKTFHRRTPLSRLATYAPMWAAGQVLPGFVRSRQDWIYGYDVTSTDQ